MPLRGLRSIRILSRLTLGVRPTRPEICIREENAPGLPTGLAVSGMLLNVALHSADVSVCRYVRKHRNAAFVRFADEFIILARSDRGLFDLMEVVWRALSEDENARLARAETESNLHLNLSKIEPRSVQEIVYFFLSDQGWKQCEQSQRCRHLCPPSAPAGSASFAGWWNARDRNDSAFARMSATLTRSSVVPGEVGPFVTTLVARMSEIGRDTLAERFGEGARDRLIRLHELARFDIDDLQVRSDTRPHVRGQPSRACLAPCGEFKTGPWRYPRLRRSRAPHSALEILAVACGRSCCCTPSAGTGSRG